MGGVPLALPRAVLPAFLAGESSTVAGKTALGNNARTPPKDGHASPTRSAGPRGASG